MEQVHYKELLGDIIIAISGCQRPTTVLNCAHDLAANGANFH